MQLKVMSFNLLYAGATNPAGSWSARLPLVLEVLRNEADVVAMQEATLPQLHDIDAALDDFTIVSGPESGETRLPRFLPRIGGMLRGFGARRRARVAAATPHVAARPLTPPAAGLAVAVVDAGKPPARHGVVHHEPRAHHVHRGEHCAILFRTDRFELADKNAFWLSHEPDVPGSVLPGSWLPRVVNWVCLKEKATGESVMVFNAHLDFLPWSPPRSARILRRVMDERWDNTPQILMGDFNAAPNSSAYDRLGQQLQGGVHPPLQDAYLLAQERVGPEGTYHGGTGRIRWIGRLDRIMVRPHVEVEKITTITHRVGSVFPSDHYPVMAELRTR